MRKLNVMPSRMDLKQNKDLKRMNQRLSGLVNITYALAMAVEGEAVDSGETAIRSIAGRLRSKVNDSCPGVAEDFGEWADRVECAISDIITTSRLATLCYLTHNFAVKLEQNYRQYDPFFDFYQMDEIKKLHEYASRYKLNAQELMSASDLLRDILKKQTI
jgi:hypothetical protein